MKLSKREKLVISYLKTSLEIIAGMNKKGMTNKQLQIIKVLSNIGALPLNKLDISDDQFDELYSGSDFIDIIEPQHAGNKIKH